MKPPDGKGAPPASGHAKGNNIGTVAPEQNAVNPIQPELKASANKLRLSDAALIERASRARNGAQFSALWRGDFEGAGDASQSEADAALLSMLRFWTSGDKERSFRLFAQSGLNREKWQREDYRERTWAAIANGAVYSPKCKPGSVAGEYLSMETESAAAWSEPKPLPADLPAVPPFKFACLPNTVRPWIEDISERMQCPPDFPAVGLMIALGSIVGRKVGIRPKRFDDWLVIPNLWGCVVGRPGLMKTPALEQALLPLRRLVAEALARYEAEMRSHAANALIYSQRKELAKRKVAKCLQKADDEAARAAAEAVASEEKNAPVLHRYEVNDSTSKMREIRFHV